MNPETKRDRRFASTLAKGLQILQAFSHKDFTLGNSELAKRTGMPPSTVARMTFTLTKLGFLQQSKTDEAYRLGPAVIALGYTARAGISFLPLAEPIMQELADEVGALVALAMLDGESVILTRCWHPRRTHSIWLSEGHRLPLNNSSPGRTILAAAEPIEGEAEQVSKDRKTLRAKGYLTSLGHWNPGINACSVPFWPDTSQAPMAFLCGATIENMPQSRLEKSVAPQLLRQVHNLDRSLGLSNLRPG